MKIPSFTNLTTTTKMLVYTLIALFILGIAVKCHAADGAVPYVQISGGSTYIRGPTEVLDAGWTWKSPQFDRDFWKTDLTLFGESTYHGQHYVNNFAVRGLYVTGFGHFDTGIGLAYLQNFLPYNGTHLNFTLELAYRFQFLPITVTVSHISDAGTRLPNLGRDFITLGWRF